MNSLTILIPTTGNLDKLRLNLLFLTKQTSKDFQISIGNNSSKNLDSFLGNFRKKLKIKLYNNNKDLGFADNLNNLISKVKTKYFLLCSDDDYLLPEAIKETLDVFKKFSNCSVLRLGFVNTQDLPSANKKYLETYYKKNFTNKILYIKNKKLNYKYLKIIDNLDNFSGIAFKKKYFKHYIYRGICSCYIGNVLRNTIKKNYIFLDKALLIITRGNLESLSYTSRGVIEDLVNCLISIKKSRNLHLLYLKKYYFYYLLNSIIVSEQFFSDYQYIKRYIKINFFKMISLFILNIIIIKNFKKYLIIIFLLISRNSLKKNRIILNEL